MGLVRQNRPSRNGQNRVCPKTNGRAVAVAVEPHTVRFMAPGRPVVLVWVPRLCQPGPQFAPPQRTLGSVRQQRPPTPPRGCETRLLDENAWQGGGRVRSH